MKRLVFKFLPALVLLVLPLASLASAARWTDEDYGRFTPETFRAHAPARRVMDPAAPDMGLFAAAVFYASNERRGARGLPPLQPHPGLRQAAEGHSRAMAALGFFDHYQPGNSSLRTPWQRMRAVGITDGFRAENIGQARGEGRTYLAAADAVVEQWMGSRKHRDNLLGKQMRHLGCGAAAGGNQGFRIMVTQNFVSGLAPAGTPRASGFRRGFP